MTIDTTLNPVIIIPDLDALSQIDSRVPSDSTKTGMSTQAFEEHENGAVSTITYAVETTTDTYMDVEHKKISEGDCNIEITEVTTNVVETVETETTNSTTYPVSLNETDFNTVVVFEGVDYYIWENGTVTTTDGEFVNLGGYEGFLKFVESELQMRKDTYPKTVFYGETRYTVYENGTATNETGDVVTTEGFAGLEKYHKPNYSIYIASGREFHVYEDGHVTYKNGTTVLEEGGITALVDYIENIDTVWIVNENLKLFVDKDGVVAFANGTILCEGGIEGAMHDFASHFDMEYGYVVTDKNETFFINPETGVVYNNKGEVVVEAGGLEAALESVGDDFNKITYNGVRYRLYFNDTVIDAEGTVFSTTGLDGLFFTLKQEKANRTYNEYECEGTRYTAYNNGSVFSNGVMVEETEGFVGCTKLLCERSRH